MNDKEKLNKCIAFVNEIIRINPKKVNIGDVSDFDAECEDCGSDMVNISFFPTDSDEYVPISEFEYLKDKAWHLLADISE